MGAEIEITPEMLVAGVAVYEGLNWDQKLSDTVQASDHEIRQLVSKVYLAMARTASCIPQSACTPTSLGRSLEAG